MKQMNVPTTMTSLLALSAGGIIGIVAPMTDSFLVAVDGKAFAFPLEDSATMKKTTSALFAVNFDPQASGDADLQQWKDGLKVLSTGEEGEDQYERILMIPELCRVVCVIEHTDIQDILDSKVSVPEGKTIH